MEDNEVVQLLENAEVIQETTTEGGTNVYVLSAPRATETELEIPVQTEISTTAVDTVVDGGSLSAIVHTILGDYVPRTQTVTVVGSDGSSVSSTEVVPGIAGLDYYWITAAVLFGLMLHGVFALTGVIFKHG